MAGGYDGEVRLRAIIEKGDATSSMLQMEAKFQKLAKEASKLNDEMREMERQKISTEQYKNLQNTFNSLVTKGRRFSEELKNTEKYVPTRTYKEAEAALDRVSSKQAKLNKKMQEWVALGRNTNSVSYRKMQMEMADCERQSDRFINALNRMEETGTNRQINDKWKDLRSQMRQAGQEAAQIHAEMTHMENENVAYVDSKSTTEYQQKAERLREVNSQMEILNQRMNEAADRQARAGNTGEQSLSKTQKAAEKAKASISGLIPVLKKSQAAFSTIGNIAKKAFNSIFSHSKKSGGMIEKFGKRVKKIALTTLIFQWVSKAFRAMIESIKSGIQNYAKYSGDFNQKMSELKSSALNLKNAIGAAAVPIVSALAPALTTLCSWLTKAVNLFNQFVSALSGKSTWSKAKEQQVDYAKSLDGTANAAQKAKGALQGFDELNVISSNDSGSGNSGGGTADVSYEEVPISDSVKKIKDILAGEDWTELGEIIAEKLNNAMQNIPWNSIQKEAEKTGQRLGTLINGFVNDFDWNLLGNTIAQGINTALIFAETFLANVDWKRLGAGLATGINGFVENLDWGLLGTTVYGGLNAFVDTVCGLAATVNWGKIGQSIGEALTTAIQGIKWIQSGEAIGEAVTGILTLFDEIIKNTDWKRLGEGIIDAIGGFFETLDWGVIGNAISNVLIALCDFFSGVIDEVDWSGIPQYIVNSISDFLINFDWSGTAESVGELLGQALKAAIELGVNLWDLLTEAWENTKDYFNDYIEDAGGNIVEGLFNGILDAIKDIATWIFEHIFEPFINGFKDAFGIHSPSTVMMEMGQYIVDGFKEGISDIWEKTKEIFENLKQKIIEKFDEIKAKVTQIWEGIKETISKKIENVEQKIHEVIENIRAFWSEKWDSISNKVTRIWESMKQKISDAITRIKEKISSVINNIQSFWRNSWNNVKITAENIWNTITSTISNKITETKNKITEVLNNIKSFWQNSWNSVKTTAQNIWNTITSTISNKITETKNKITEVLGNIKSFWDETWTNMKTSVIDIFNGIWDGIKGIINSIIGGVEKMANSVISGINAMIDSMNKLSWDIPDWVPVIGGNKFGLSIPTVTNVSIPRLANGGITTGSTLANIGEAGREAVLPLENNLSYMEPLADMIASKLDGVQVVRIEAKENGIFEIVREQANDYYRRTGRPAFDF